MVSNIYEWFITYCGGLDLHNDIVFLCLKNVFIIANIAVPDMMPHGVASRFLLHVLIILFQKQHHIIYINIIHFTIHKF